MRKATLIHVLIISIFLLVLFTCPFVSAQSHQLADEYLNKAQELQKQVNYIEVAKMYEKSVEAEKASPRITALHTGLSRMTDLLEDLHSELYAASHFSFLVANYDKALKYYKEALAIDKRLGSVCWKSSRLLETKKKICRTS